MGRQRSVKCNDPACTGNNETITTVDSTSVGSFTSITIGADANPIISYHDIANGDLKVAVIAHTAWVPNNWGR